MVGGANSPLKSNPISTRDAQRVQTNLVNTRTERSPQRQTELCLSISYGCMGCWRYGLLQARGPGCSRLGYGISPLGGGCHYPTIELPVFTQACEIDSRRAKQNLVHQDPEERSSDPTGDCPGLACGCPGVSGGGVCQWWPAAGLGALSVAVHACDPLKEVTIIFIAFTIVWPQVNDRDTASPINRKLD